MQPYHTTTKTIPHLVIVAVVEDLINTGEEVDVKDGLEGGSDKGEHGSIDGEDVNSRVGLRGHVCEKDEESAMCSNQKRSNREWNTRELYSFQRAL